MAGNSATFDAKDFERLKKAFSRLPDRAERNVVKGAVGAAARVLRKEMHNRIPVALGHLRDNFGTKVKPYTNRSLTVGIIGARSKWIPVPRSIRWTKTGKVNPALYSHLTGGDRGESATKWMQRGFQAGLPVAKQRMFKNLQRGIEREAKKLGWK